MADLTIKKYHLVALLDYLESINRKAAKLSQPPMSVETVREYSMTVNTDQGLPRTTDMIDIVLHGCEPKIMGWTLAGTLEFTEGGTIVRGVPDVEIPAEYRTADNTCDHCHTKRLRDNVVLLHNNKTGRFFQVGSTCVADFLGMRSAKSYLAWLNTVQCVVADIDDLLEGVDGCLGGRVERCFAIDEFVAAASIISRRFGWVPKSRAIDEGSSTARQTWDFLCPPMGAADAHTKNRWIEENKLHVVDRDKERTALAIAWIKAEEADNDYIHNLQVIANKGYVNYREAGFAASLLSAHRKATDWAKEKKRSERPNSEYVGEVKGRYRFEDLTVKSMQSIDGTYGLRTMVRFETADGNILLWWATGEPEWLETGDTVTVAATVKKHDEYRGTKQTTINRVTTRISAKLHPITQGETCA